MTKILMASMACFIALAVSAAAPGWTTDLAKAEAQAKTEDKLLLLYFTGSDFCPPCKELDKHVFSSEEFRKFATTNLVLVEFDFPLKKDLPAELKQSNAAARKQFNAIGFPTIVVLGPDGRELWRGESYDGESAKAFIARLQKLKKR